MESTHLPRDLDASYRLLEEIGQGGMSTVFRGIRNQDGKEVAIKVLTNTRDPSAAERFSREVRVLASLDHPNIVEVLSFGRSNGGHHYLVLELIRGASLLKILDDFGALPVHRGARIVEQVAAALSVIHEAGFVHRDLKPGNVMLTRKRGNEDFAMLLDFGIVKPAGEGRNLTEKGKVVGTLNAVAPEQLNDEAVDGRTDLYALGVLFFRMLTGVNPFEAKNPVTLAHKILNDPAPVPSSVAPHAQIPMVVDTLIARCLEKQREHRFQNAQALIKALTSAGLTQPPTDPNFPVYTPSDANVPFQDYGIDYDAALQEPIPGTPVEDIHQQPTGKLERSGPRDVPQPDASAEAMGFGGNTQTGRVVATSPRAIFISSEMSQHSMENEPLPSPREPTAEEEVVLRVKKKRRKRPKPMSAPPAKKKKRKKRSNKKAPSKKPSGRPR
jgi:serine/threonine-protein kinase